MARSRAALQRMDWSLSALLLVQAVTLFVAIPLSGRYPSAHMLLDLCRILFATICIVTLTRHRLLQVALLFALALFLGGPAVVRQVLPHLGFDADGTMQHELIEAAAFAFTAAVTALVARHVFGPGRVNMHRVQGAVLVYLNIAALFAIAYGAIVARWPDAILFTSGARLPFIAGERTAAIAYFSLTTITTTGYGDLVPVAAIARSLANLEAVVGQLFPATLLARIVALNLEHSRGGD